MAEEITNPHLIAAQFDTNSRVAYRRFGYAIRNNAFEDINKYLLNNDFKYKSNLLEALADSKIELSNFLIETIVNIILAQAVNSYECDMAVLALFFGGIKAKERLFVEMEKFSKERYNQTLVVLKLNVPEEIISWECLQQ